MKTEVLLQFLGIMMAVSGMAGLIRTKHFVKLIDEIEHSTFDMFVLSVLRLMTGLVFVLGHNLWTGRMEALVSGFGWLIFVTGIIGLIFPEFVLKNIPPITKSPMRMRARMMISFVAGIALAMLGFGLVG